MIYYRCKCGDRQSWSSMGEPRCVVCDKCGSTLGTSPTDHLPVEPHRFSAWRWDIDQRTGVRFQVLYCTACTQKEQRSEADALADASAEPEAPV